MVLVSKPDKGKCKEVARRFIRISAPSIPENILENIAETAVWNLFTSREDGCLEIIEDDKDWVWPD